MTRSNDSAVALPSSFAEALAALYGDPDDREFSAAVRYMPTLEHIEAVLPDACERGEIDYVQALLEAKLQLLGGPLNGTTRALCWGSKAGLWRTH